MVLEKLGVNLERRGFRLALYGGDGSMNARDGCGEAMGESGKTRVQPGEARSDCIDKKGTHTQEDHGTRTGQQPIVRKDNNRWALEEVRA